MVHNTSKPDVEVVDAHEHGPEDGWVGEQALPRKSCNKKAAEGGVAVVDGCVQRRFGVRAGESGVAAERWKYHVTQGFLNYVAGTSDETCHNIVAGGGQMVNNIHRLRAFHVLQRLAQFIHQRRIAIAIVLELYHYHDPRQRKFERIQSSKHPSDPRQMHHRPDRGHQMQHRPHRGRDVELFQ